MVGIVRLLILHTIYFGTQRLADQLLSVAGGVMVLLWVDDIGPISLLVQKQRKQRQDKTT